MCSSRPLKMPGTVSPKNVVVLAGRSVVDGRAGRPLMLVFVPFHGRRPESGAGFLAWVAFGSSMGPTREPMTMVLIRRWATPKSAAFRWP